MSCSIFARTRLGMLFNKIVEVNVMDSNDAAHLTLLKRPELGITFTKLNCWTLTEYNKCVFMDADTMVSFIINRFLFSCHSYC